MISVSVRLTIANKRLASLDVAKKLQSLLIWNKIVLNQILAASDKTTLSISSSLAKGALSIASYGTILSVGSVGSVLSIGSAGSILSICSAGSILSIGSAGSILSFMSAGSVLSALSINSRLGFLKNPALS